MRLRTPLALPALLAVSALSLCAQTTALDAWQTDIAGDTLDQLDGFQRSGGEAINGSISTGSEVGDVLLSLNTSQTLVSKGSLPVPTSTAPVPLLAVHGRIALSGASGSAGVGIADSSASLNWYYLLLNGSQVILRRSSGGTESNLGLWSFSPGSSMADVRLVASYATPGRIVFTVRYGLAGAVTTTQTATDLSPVSFSSGRLRTVVVTRSGRAADFALATRILEPNTEPPGIAFPPSANVINVRSAPYNAAGDGVTDDTAAIQAAISASVGSAQGMRTLYFPNGTYLVSRRLEWKNTSGQWENLLTLQGQSRDGTVIRLRDSANSGTDNFTNPAAPRALIFTASELNSASPTAGGKDYTNLGEGNAAFGNSLFNLTIDTGNGNPGAIAVDFLSNNSGAIKSVTLRSSDGQGVAGLGLIRKWTGPLLVKDVRIDGFQTGILTQNTNYCATLEHVTLRNQSAFGVDNQAGVVLAIRGLLFQSSNANAVALRNNGTGGLVTMLESLLLGANPSSPAIINSGGTPGLSAILARCILTDGFSSALSHNGSLLTSSVLAEYVSGGSTARFPDSATHSLHLPIEETPVHFEPDPMRWVNVQDFGASPEDALDDTSSIQAAIDSTAPGQPNAGRTILHLPQGTSSSSRYLVASTVTLRHGIRKVEGNFARISASGNYFEDWNFPNPVIRIAAGTTAEAVFLERIEFRTENLTVTPLSIEHDAPRTLVIKHTDLNGVRTTQNAGKLFLEDVTAHTLTSLFRLEGPSPAFARQLNPEDLYNTKIRVLGSSLWCLGLKTERPGPVLHAVAGARVEVLGGLFHNAVHPSPSGLPAVIVDNAAVSLSCATVGSGTLRYDVDVRETRSGITLDQTLANSPDRPGQTASSSLLPLHSAWEGNPALALATVAVTASTPYAAEPSTAGVFTFTRSGPTSLPLTVSYVHSGTAQPGSDYVAFPGTVTIPAGARSATVALTPLDDFIAEYPEKVTLTVQEGAAYRAGWPSQASVSLTDNDVANGAPPAANLVMWLRADGGVVTDPQSALGAWRDQTGNGNHAINDEALRRPLWQQGVAGQFVSQPQVTFQNRAFLLLQPSATLQRAAAGYISKTHAVLFRTGSDVTSRQVLWEQGSDVRGLNLYLDGGSLHAGAWNAPSSGGWRVFRSTPVAAHTEYLAILVFDAQAQTVTAFLGSNPFAGPGSTIGTVGPIPTQGDESTLGGMISKTLFHDGPSVLSGYSFSGAMAEVFAWNSALDAARRAELESYVNGKYAQGLVLASLAATVPDAAESPYSEGAFTISRTGPTDAPLTLSYQVSGTALNGVDYELLPGSITLGPGVSSAPVHIRPLSDPHAEFAESVTLSLLSGPGYSLSGAASDTVTLLQDVVLPRAIHATAAPGGSEQIALTLANPSAVSATVFTLDIPANYVAVRSDSTDANRPGHTWQEIVSNNRRDAVLFDFSNASAASPGFPGGDHDTPSAAVPLGFSFPFHGSAYSSVRISCDGWMSFDPTVGPAPQNLDLGGGNPAAPAALIAPFWRTQHCGWLSAVAYRRVDPETFIVQWHRMSSGVGEDDFLSEIPDYQATLKSDGTIFFSYQLYQVPASPVRLYSIGIQNAGRDRALSLRSGIYLPGTGTYASFNPGYLSTLPLTVRLDPPQGWLRASAPSVTVPPGGTANVLLTLDASSLAQGESRSFTVPVIASQPGSPVVSLPVTLLADGSPQGGSTFADWILASSVPADQRLPGADPDRDGLANLLEYALDADPAIAGTTIGPRIDTVLASGAHHLSLTFPRTRPELSYEVQASSDLVLWSTIAVNPGMIGGSATAMDPEPLAANARRFLRLRIQAP